jgi:hypothetical protein
MNIKELNKLIKEELDAFLEAEDDIKITTDEPDVKSGEEAMDLLRQIYDLIKPEMEGGEGGEPEMDMDMGEPEMDMDMDMEEPDGEDKPEDKKDDKKDKKDDKDKDDEEDKKLQESYMLNRFKKLANIRG